MKIAVGSDHAGFDLKENLKNHLIKLGNEVVDCGALSDARSDYPDFAKGVATRVSENKVERGILVCGSGIGMCMTANRFQNVRAVVLHDSNDAELSRKHNDANVACIGSRVTKIDDAIKLVDIFLKTEFEGGRHANRVAKIEI